MKFKTFAVICLVLSARVSFCVVVDVSLNIGELNTHVLTGTYSSIAGGSANTVIGDLSVIGGGAYNTISSNIYDFIGGGAQNSIYGQLSAIVGGQSNTVTGDLSVIGGGAYNTISSNIYDFIGGGAQNSIYGQLSAIVGGQFNGIYNGHYNFIGGGFNNYVIGFGNIVGGGLDNLNYGIQGTTLAGGELNNIGSATAWVTLSGGWANSIPASYYGTIGGGFSNVLSADMATIPGGSGASASQYGQQAYASGSFIAAGDAQSSLYVMRNNTSTSNTTELYLDGNSIQLTIASGSTWTFEIQVVGRNNSGDSAGYLSKGVIENVGGTTTSYGVVTSILWEDVAGWDASVSGSDGFDALIIEVTGDNTAIRWVATVRTTEVKD